MIGTVVTDSTELSTSLPEAESISASVSQHTVQAVLPAPKIWATGLLLATSMTTSCFIGAPAARAMPLGDHTTRPIARTLDPDTEAARESENRATQPLKEQTKTVSELDSATLVKNIHDESGLTWEQLSKTLGVSRRSVHLWASGGRMNARHIELMSDLARLVRSAPVASPAGVRAWLLASDSGEPSPLEAFKLQHRRGDTPVSGVGYTASQLIGVDAD